MSTLYSSRSSSMASASTAQKNAHLGVGQKVYVYSDPGCCEYPFATKCALYCSMVPSDLYLTLNTQRLLIGFWLFGRRTTLNTPLSMSARSSSCAAQYHIVASSFGRFRALQKL